MEIGTIIRQTHQINNYPERDGFRWEYVDYRLEDGLFEVIDPHGDLHGEFRGLHFVCIGSSYWPGSIGEVRGLEILREKNITINPSDTAVTPSTSTEVK